LGIAGAFFVEGRCRTSKTSQTIIFFSLPNDAEMDELGVGRREESSEAKGSEGKGTPTENHDIEK